MIFCTTFDSPLQPLLLLSDGEALTGLFLRTPSPELAAAWVQDDSAAPFADAKRQLAEYFAGTRTAFDLPLAPPGTPFQQRVWDELCRVPYGATVTYGDLARRLGQPNACRAVGMANGSNPISILIPCHRVVGASGKLIGFSGGLSRKEALLALEQTGEQKQLGLF